MAKRKADKKMVVYQAKSGAIELRGDLARETLWATQAQIAEAFEVDVRTINEHIQNILKTKELREKAAIRNFRIVQKEGTREVDRKVKHYNLDMILSVGYRVNSKRATLFRQWATRTLKGYIVDGFVVDKRRIAKNYDRFLEVVNDIRKLLPAGTSVSPKDAVELISLFADTWLSLDAYDRGALPKGKLTKKKVSLTAEGIAGGLGSLKQELVRKKEATDMFGAERSKGSVAGIVGNVMQAFGGNDMYPTAEEKAAHLLYFMVKNHPFTDGNKRSGAFAFVWFLRQAGILDVAKLTPSALTALTVLVAESEPNHKDKVIKLIMNLIAEK
ncbi:MAG: virulence protein RhuM/Fic/DOC family protein [Patescibacteria group bacterium]|nr:virulence protein RhuM/Fic/DOC family protein [Patescibacteria group bacterium]